MVHLSGIVEEPLDVEVQVRQEVDFVEHKDGCGTEHVWVLQWFVLAFGHGGNDNLGPLAQVEERRTDKIAHVFDENDRTDGRCEFDQTPVDHRSVQVATSAGVNLNHLTAGLPNPLGIVGGRLISFQGPESQLRPEIADRSLQQRGLPRAWGTDEVQGQYLSTGEPTPVPLGKLIVLLQYLLFEPQRPPAVVVIMAAGVAMGVIVTMRMVMIMTALVIMSFEGPGLPGLQVHQAGF